MCARASARTCVCVWPSVYQARGAGSAGCHVPGGCVARLCVRVCMCAHSLTDSLSHSRTHTLTNSLTDSTHSFVRKSLSQCGLRLHSVGQPYPPQGRSAEIPDVGGAQARGHARARRSMSELWPRWPVFRAGTAQSTHTRAHMCTRACTRTGHTTRIVLTCTHTTTHTHTGTHVHTHTHTHNTHGYPPSKICLCMCACM